MTEGKRPGQRRSAHLTHKQLSYAFVFERELRYVHADHDQPVTGQGRSRCGAMITRCRET
jgi:hypothetical protein